MGQTDLANYPHRVRQDEQCRSRSHAKGDLLQGDVVFIGFCEGRGTTMPILMAMGISFVLIEFPLFFAAHHFFTFVQELLWMAMIIASVTGLGLLMVSFRTALGTSDINDSGAR